MPYRKNTQSLITRIEEDTLWDFIKLGKEVVVCKHYTLWSTGCTRSKDDCCKVITLTLFQFFFYFTFIFDTPLLACLHKLFIEKNLYAGCLCLIKILLFNFAFNRNNCFESRKLVFKIYNLFYLRVVFNNTIFCFCNRKDFFKIVRSSITATRYINCTNIHNSQIYIKPFCTVIRNKTNRFSALNSKTKECCAKIKTILIKLAVKNWFKLPILNTLHLTCNFCKFCCRIADHFRDCVVIVENHNFLLQKK